MQDSSGRQAYQGPRFRRDASVGAQAACESESSILRALEGSALAVLAAGLGGGTGSGVAPEAARLAKEQGAYVVSVVIRPFRFEGDRRAAQADEALSRLALYSDMVLRFDNDAMESLIDPDKGVLEAFSVVNALIARAVLIVPSLLNSSGSLLRVGLDDLLSVAGTGKGICSFGVGEASADASVADILNQVRHSPLFLEKRLGEVDDVLVLVRGGGSLTLQRLEDLVDGVAEILGRGVRLHIGASVEQQPEERLSLTVLGAVPVAETSVSVCCASAGSGAADSACAGGKIFPRRGKPLFSLLLLPRLTNRNGIRSRTFPSPSPGGMNVNWKRNWCP
ncbi:MAG: hypothetical protein ACLT38_05070 [Akkermansia sp.]